MLKARTAIVTGSTIGIAEALAAADADVMLNCFGDAGQIEELRQTLGVCFNAVVAREATPLLRATDTAMQLGGREGSAKIHARSRARGCWPIVKRSSYTEN